MRKQYHVEVMWEKDNHGKVETHFDRIYSLATLDEAIYLCDDLAERLQTGESEFQNAIYTAPYVLYRNTIVYRPVA